MYERDDPINKLSTVISGGGYLVMCRGNVQRLPSAPQTRFREFFHRHLAGTGRVVLTMKYSWLAIIAITFTAISAQRVPQCIQDCITAQCPDPTDNVVCFCDPANGPPIQDCIANNCSNRQANATTSLQNLCCKVLRIDRD